MTFRCIYYNGIEASTNHEMKYFTDIQIFESVFRIQKLYQAALGFQHLERAIRTLFYLMKSKQKFVQI